MRNILLLSLFLLAITSCKEKDKEEVWQGNLIAPRKDTGSSNLDFLLDRLLDRSGITYLKDSILVCKYDTPDQFEDNNLLKPDTFRWNTFTVLYYNNYDSGVNEIYLNGHKFQDSFSYFDAEMSDNYTSMAWLDLFNEYNTHYGFIYNGKKYYYFTGPMRMCNGIGCNYLNYFLYDATNYKMNVIQLGYLSTTNFIGDANNDGQLDFLLVDAQGPHTTDTGGWYGYSVSLYSLDSSGKMALQKDRQNNPYYIEGKYAGWAIGDSSITIQSANWPKAFDKSAIK